MTEHCTYCGGNDADTPCAYPSEGKPGCLRTAEKVQAQVDSFRKAGQTIIGHPFKPGTHPTLWCTVPGCGWPKENHE